MVNPEIEHDLPSLLKTLKKLQLDITEFVFDVNNGKEYNDELSLRLFRVHNFLKRINN